MGGDYRAPPRWGADGDPPRTSPSELPNRLKMPSPKKTQNRRPLRPSRPPLTEAQLQTARLYARLDRSRFSAAANRQIDEAIQRGEGIKANAVPRLSDVATLIRGVITGTSKTTVPVAAAGTVQQLSGNIDLLQSQRRAAARAQATRAASDRMMFGAAQVGATVARRKGKAATYASKPKHTPSPNRPKSSPKPSSRAQPSSRTQTAPKRAPAKTARGRGRARIV